MRQIVDITGNKYGKLTVIAYHHSDEYNKSHWLCECECGNRKILRKDNFANAHSQTVSCGCVRTENIRKAGQERIKRLNETKGSVIE